MKLLSTVYLTVLALPIIDLEICRHQEGYARSFVS
jgi:hypothetical protein